MNNGITADNILSLLPPVLKQNNTLNAIASSAASALERLHTDEVKAVIYSRIDELPEEVLDALAYDFKIDWYSYSYSLEEKRKTVKESWNVHRRLGTKAAVLNAIGAIYENTQIEEWFEYSGKPYHFKLLIDASYQSVDPDKHKQVLDSVRYYKPLRSVLDVVEYIGDTASAEVYFGASLVGITCEGMSFTAENY